MDSLQHVLFVRGRIVELLDEKGMGRGLGMNSNSKHIQQAQDTSNVSFEDVKGVEEANQNFRKLSCI